MNIFSPTNSKYANPQLKTIGSNFPGYIIKDRPYHGLSFNYQRIPYGDNGTVVYYKCYEFPESDPTNISPERNNKHHSVVDYYDQQLGYSPYYKLTSHTNNLPEYMLVDTTNINLGYTITYGDLSVQVLFRSEHIGKLLFRRFDGSSYNDEDGTGTGGFLGTGSVGPYQNSPDANLGYWMTYRPVYNVSQDIYLNTPELTNSKIYLRFSPAWLWYEFFPSGGGVSFNGALTPPNWHICMPGYAPKSPTEYWITLETNETSDGTFTLTIDGETTAEISIAHGSDLANNIKNALVALDPIYNSYVTYSVADYFNEDTYQKTIVSLLFSNNSNSPFKDREIDIGVSNALLIDTLLYGSFRTKSTSPWLSQLMFFFPTDWYSYSAENKTKEHRQWYNTKPTTQIENVGRTPFNVIPFTMDNLHWQKTLGTLSPYRTTSFHPVSYEVDGPNFPLFISNFTQLPSDVVADRRKIRVTPVYL